MVLEPVNWLNVDHSFGSEVCSRQRKAKHMLLKSNYENSYSGDVLLKPDGRASSSALVQTVILETQPSPRAGVPFYFQVSWRGICVFLLEFANKQHLSQCGNSGRHKYLTLWS